MPAWGLVEDVRTYFFLDFGVWDEVQIKLSNPFIKTIF